MRNVLIVDDEPAMCAALEANFERRGWQVQTAGGVNEALAKFRSRPARLVVTDMRMGDGDGLQVMEGVRMWMPETPVILLTAYGSVPGAVQAIREGACDYLQKGVAFEELEAASQGPLASGRLGFELFDKPNWSGSDFSEKVNYQRALEGELERTIQTMNGVEAVRVHLVLPRESLFTDRERPAKAAVVLKLRGARLNDAVSASVANLVSSSWEDLSPQNVAVVTTDGQMQGTPRGHGAVMIGENQELETLLAERVVQTLTPVVGAEHVKSSVTIDYDATSGESTQETYDPNATAVLSSQTSQETVGDLEPAGIPGTASNVPNSQGNAAAAQQAKAASTSQGVRTESKTYAVSRTTRHVLEPSGRVKRVAAAILVDDAVESKAENGKIQERRRKRTPEEMKQIEELAKAAIGFDGQRGDLFSLQNISFQQSPADVPAPPSKFQRALTFAEHWTGLLRYAALLLLFGVLYLLILRPVKNRVIGLLQLPAPQPMMAAAAAPGGALPAAAEAQTSGPEVQQAVALKRELLGRVKDDPESAGRLIQNWLREGQEKR